MDIYAVIMAGGVGSRFWPRSKKKKPKQLIRIFGENTMIQDTALRLENIVKPENIFIITNVVQKERVEEQLPHIPKENVIAEPFGRNTAPAIALAAKIIEKRNPEAVMLTFPADHLITNVKEFHKTLQKAINFAATSDGLVTIGIQPTHPETGYGYIQFDESEIGNGIYNVMNFAEKPNFKTATRFLKSGDFLWNSGMFIWRVDSILSEIKKYLPDLCDGLTALEPVIGKKKFDSVLETVYGKIRSVSIDYGVMEKSKKVFLVKSAFGWSDVGSWEAVYNLSEKDKNENAAIGDVYTKDVKGSYIFSPKKFSAVIGVENLIVINTENALLVCKRENAQDVKDVVEYLKLNERKELL